MTICIGGPLNGEPAPECAGGRRCFVAAMDGISLSLDGTYPIRHGHYNLRAFILPDRRLKIACYVWEKSPKPSAAWSRCSIGLMRFCNNFQLLEVVPPPIDRLRFAHGSIQTVALPHIQACFRHSATNRGGCKTSRYTQFPIRVKNPGEDSNDVYATHGQPGPYPLPSSMRSREQPEDSTTKRLTT